MKPKKRNERANDIKALYKRVKTMPPKKRAETVNSKEGQYWLSLLTPTQFAELFPTYYKKERPDLGLTVATSGAIIKGGQTPLLGGGGGPGTSKVQGAPGTASPVPSGRGGGGRGKFYPRGAPSAEPSPPDPLKVLKKGIEDKTGIKIVPPSESKNLADMRKTHTDEINSKPEVKTKLYALMKAEVGGQGEEAQQAFLETVFNRAGQRGVSIDTIISDRAYYEPHQNGAFERAQRNLNKDDMEKYDRSISKVTAGSNLTEGGMHNASAGVAASARQGGYDSIPSTVKEVGGETYYGKTWEKKHREQINQAYKDGLSANRNVAQSGSTDINAHPLTPITKPIGMNEDLAKLWDTFKTPQEQARFVEALNKLAQEGKSGVDVANDMAKAAPKLNGVPQIPASPENAKQFPQGTERFFREGGKVERADGVKLNEKLVNVLKEASKDLPEGYHVKMFSGADDRRTGTKNHPGGVAIDLAIVDGNGKRLADRGFGEGHKIYEQLAQSMRERGKDMYPGTEYIWGGAWTVAGGDRMHYQIVDPDQRVPGASKSSGAYDWERGIDPGFWGGQRAASQFMTKEELRNYQDSVREKIKKEREDKEAAKAKQINEEQRAKAETGSPSINQHPLTPDMKTLNEPTALPVAPPETSADAPVSPPVPLNQRGISSGHPGAATPTPAPSPPPAAEEGREYKLEMDSKDGKLINPIKNNPQPSLTAPNNRAENTIPTDHPKPEPSFDRAMKNTGIGRPGETGTTTYKT